MNFYNLIYKSISIYLHLKKVVYMNYFKYIYFYNFIWKRNFKKTFISLFTKILKFNPILLIIIKKKSENEFLQNYLQKHLNLFFIKKKRFIEEEILFCLI